MSSWRRLCGLPLCCVRRTGCTLHPKHLHPEAARHVCCRRRRCASAAGNYTRRRGGDSGSRFRRRSRLRASHAARAAGLGHARRQDAAVRPLQAGHGGRRERSDAGNVLARLQGQGQVVRTHSHETSPRPTRCDCLDISLPWTGQRQFPAGRHGMHARGRHGWKR